jgi:hypothetical protein
MVSFQEERSKLGQLSLTMMIRGKILFKALEESAETEELKILTGTYRRHLEHELHAYKNGHSYEGDKAAAAEEA